MFMRFCAPTCCRATLGMLQGGIHPTLPHSVWTPRSLCQPFIHAYNNHPWSCHQPCINSVAIPHQHLYLDLNLHLHLEPHLQLSLYHSVSISIFKSKSISIPIYLYPRGSLQGQNIWAELVTIGTAPAGRSMYSQVDDLGLAVGYPVPNEYMGGCQNYGPLLGPLNTRCRTMIRNQKGTIILTTTHMVSSILCTI